MDERHKIYPLSIADVATRLNLIFRVHGLEQAESYFNNIPQKLKGFGVYLTLLNCYAREKSVEKAEPVMLKLKDMGLSDSPLSYNILMNLYYQTGSKEKLDALVQEMDEKSCYDNYSFTILLSAYAAASDSKAIDKIVNRMEVDPKIIWDCSTCAIAADGYLKVGLVENGRETVEQAEEFIRSLRAEGIFTAVVHNKLLDYIKAKK
ncbi:hypothetical protein U1Q18_009180 [Sarracenia purpurea var. burkii]